MGSLVVGVAFAKAYGLSLGIPVVGVNHIEAHLHAATLELGPSPFPAVALVVSGGHTELVEVGGVGDYRWLGSTRDDAAGEAFDKVAKLLGLGFPGGPVIERLAHSGRRDAFDFPRPMLDQPGYDFSFSGLKTAVAMALRARGTPPYPRTLVADIAASFQAAATDVLVAKTVRAVGAVGAGALTLGGGVACNRELRERLAPALAAAVRRQRRDDRAGGRMGARPGRGPRARARRGGLARGIGTGRSGRFLAGRRFAFQHVLPYEGAAAPFGPASPDNDFSSPTAQEPIEGPDASP